MRLKTRDAWRRPLTAVALVALTAVLGAVVLSVAGRRTPPADGPVPARGPRITIDGMEDAVHFEIRGGSKRLEVRMDRYTTGPDGWRHLEGNVEVLDFGRTGGRQIRLRADRIAHDPDLTRFRAEGGCTLEDGDVTVEAPDFEYDRATEVVRTASRARITTPRLRAEGDALTYLVPDTELRLEGGVRVEAVPEDGGTPAVLEAPSALFHRRGRTGVMTGGARFTRGASGGSAAALTFVLTSDEREIESLMLRDGASVRFAADGGEVHTLAAEEIAVVSDTATHTVAYVEGKGGCRIGLGAGPDGRAGPGGHDVEAGRAILYFEPSGRLKDFAGFEGVRLRSAALGDEDPAAAGEALTAEGERLEFNRPTSVLNVHGGAAPAKLRSASFALEGSRLSANRETGNLIAEGGFQLVLESRPADARTPGFFAGGQPVFVTGGGLRYLKAERQFLFRENVRAWQGRDVLLAAELDFREDGEKILGRGGVQSTLFHTPRAAEAEERMLVGGEEMSFSAADRALAFAVKAFLASPRLRLEAARLEIRLRPESAGLEAVIARGSVSIVQGRWEGQGEEALYDFSRDVVTLTGRPRLIDKERGVTEGDKLTFHPADGKITIENDERDRSVTVIKS